MFCHTQRAQTLANLIVNSYIRLSCTLWSALTMMPLRRVHLSELQTCTCRKVPIALIMYDEEMPMRCFECVKPIRHTGSAAAHLRWLQLTVRLLVATEEKFAATLFDAVVPKVIPDSAEQSCPMPAGFQSPDSAFNGYAQGRNAAVRGRAATGTRCCQFIENDGWTIISNETDGLMDPDF